MRLEVFILDGIGSNDATAIVTGADQDHRLVVISPFEAALVPPMPVLCNLQRGNEVVDFLYFIAPTAIDEIRRGQTCAAKELLHLIARQFFPLVKETQELASHRLGIRRWLILYLPRTFVE